jgi:hypothetical protein
LVSLITRARVGEARQGSAHQAGSGLRAPFRHTSPAIRPLLLRAGAQALRARRRSLILAQARRSAPYCGQMRARHRTCKPMTDYVTQDTVLQVPWYQRVSACRVPYQISVCCNDTSDPVSPIANPLILNGRFVGITSAMLGVTYASQPDNGRNQRSTHHVTQHLHSR